MHADRENLSAKFWLDPTSRSQQIMGTAVENYGTSSVSCVRIWRPCDMNGTPFSMTTLTLPRIVSATVTDDTVSVDLEDGRTIAVPIGWYPRLAHGTPAERANMQISGAGYGLHWPELDEDIGIEGLIVGKQSTESTASFERWLQGRQVKPQETA
jgi:hypothetical protein